MRENNGWESWNMVKIFDFPCNNKREAEQKASKDALKYFGQDIDDIL